MKVAQLRLHMHVQVVGERQGSTYLSMKLKDQAKAMHLLETDPVLSGLTRLEAPYLDLEVRGLPALSYFASTLWQPAMEQWSQGVSQCAETQNMHRTLTPIT